MFNRRDTVSRRTPFQEWAERAWKRFVPVPFCFMGMGLLRVWTETLYASGTAAFPALQIPFAASAELPSVVDGYTVFEAFVALALVLLVAFARRLAPLCQHGSTVALTLFCMVGATCAGFGSIIAPQSASILFWPTVGLGGVGIALALMLWSEFFGCLNPVRAAVYYAASAAVGSVVLWFFKGMSLWALWAGTCLVPVVSLLCLWRAYATLPVDAFPPRFQRGFSFPWKPVAVVGIYTLVYGMRIGIFSSALSVYSGVGSFIAALGAYAAISLRITRVAKKGGDGESEPQPEAFDFSLLYRIAIPLMLVSIIPIESVVPGWKRIADASAFASYTLLLILIMVILSNLSYRYGVCALWIFGIERVVRLVATQCGRIAGETTRDACLPLPGEIAISLFMAAMLVFVAVILFSEKNVSASQWGIVLNGDLALHDARTLDRNRLAVKCSEFGKRIGLTPREEEVMLLLARGETQGEIARELCVGTNTVKTHTRHVYQKLGIHSRPELLQLLGVKQEG